MLTGAFTSVPSQTWDAVCCVAALCMLLMLLFPSGRCYASCGGGPCYVHPSAVDADADAAAAAARCLVLPLRAARYQDAADARFANWTSQECVTKACLLAHARAGLLVDLAAVKQLLARNLKLLLAA